MLLTEYDEKRHLANTREEGFKEGISQQQVRVEAEKKRADQAEEEVRRLREEIARLKKQG